MNWWDDTLIAFDTETTGVDPETARIVTASVAIIEREGGGSTVATHEWLIDPGIEIPAEATAVHGITTERAREEGTSPASALNDIQAILDDARDAGLPVIVYNAPYDLTLLDREIRRHWGDAEAPRPGAVVNPLVLDKALDRYRKGKRTLSAVSAHYKVPISDADAHGSTADALCAARVAWKIARLYPQACEDLDALQARQVAWYRDGARSFRDYLLRLRASASDAEASSLDAKIAGISEDWPMRAAAVEVVV